MTEVRPISVSQFKAFHGVEEMLSRYAEESAIDGMPKFKPDWNAYIAMENVGAFHLIGVFVEDVIVGFISVMVTVMPHYSVPVAVTESFYVLPEYRKGGNGVKLLKEAEAYAVSKGAEGLLVSAPYSGDLDRYLSNTKRYRQTNAVFFKRL